MLVARTVAPRPTYHSMPPGEQLTLPRIVKRRLIRGRNVYHHRTVLQLEVDLGHLAGRSTRSAGPEFARRFTERFPSRPDQIQGYEIDAEFLARLESRDGAPIEEALLHAVLAIEAAVLATIYALDPIEFAAVLLGRSAHQAFLTWETHSPEMSRSSATLAFEGMGELLTQASGIADGGLFESGLQSVKERAIRRRLSGSTSLLKTAANRRGIPSECITGQHLRLGEGIRQHHFFSSLMGSTSFGAAKLALDKRHCNRRLAELSLPVPLQISVADPEEALTAATEIGWPVVIKPSKGNQGRGVTVGLHTAQEVGPAFDYASSEQSGVVVEEWVPGRDYRLLVVGGRFVAALTCLPPTVTGDGKRTVRELVEKLNEEPDRDDLRLSRVTINSEMERHLANERLGIDDVLSQGRTIALRASGHVATGGIPIDVTDRVHPDNRSMAERAAAAVGLEVAGVDFVTTDISRSHLEIGGTILEVNSRPGLCMHVWPRQGLSRDVAGPILDIVFPPGDSGSVPKLLVAGDRGIGPIARATAAWLRDNGVTVGLSLRRAAYLAGKPVNISAGNLAHAPRLLLRAPSLECLVAAISLRRTATHGLGLEACDAAAILPREHDGNTAAFDKGIEVLVKANRGRFVVTTSNTAARVALAGLDPGLVILVAARREDADAASQIAAGRAAVVKSWRGGEPLVTLFDKGRPVASAPIPDRARARPKDLEAHLCAFALTNAVGLGGSVSS